MNAPRIIITGGPRCGKSVLSTVLADKLGIDRHAIQHTDDLVGVLAWSDASAEVARWIAKDGPWIMECVALPRALRKALAAAPLAKPVDRVLYLSEPVVPQSLGQRAMAKGCWTVFAEIEPALHALGVEITVGRAPPLVRTSG